MYCYHDKIEKKDIGGGILMQELGPGDSMNVLHWNMEDGSVVKLHAHPEEQFGYVIEGGFDMTIGDERVTLKKGDSYYVPSNVQHTFTAIGQTEAIDVFHPVRTDIPGKKS